MSRISKILIERKTDNILHSGNLFSNFQSYLVIHMASSLLGLIDWWVTNDAPYSIETMAMIYERLVVQATWHALSGEEMHNINS